MKIINKIKKSYVNLSNETRKQYRNFNDRIKEIKDTISTIKQIKDTIQILNKKEETFKKESSNSNNNIKTKNSDDTIIDVDFKEV